MSIRVVIVDDHRIVLDGLRGFLQGQAGIEIVGEATNGRLAVALVRQCRPDLVLMDVTMPELNGIDATKEIRRFDERVGICALTMHTDRGIVVAMIEAGADGYLVKSSPLQDVINAIQTIVSGGTYFSSDVAESLSFAAEGAEGDAGQDALGKLSDMDRQVLQLVSEGKSSKEIAPVLYVTKKTVDYHRQCLMDKLGIRSVAELTKFAIRQGLTTVDFPWVRRGDS